MNFRHTLVLGGMILAALAFAAPALADSHGKAAAPSQKEQSPSTPHGGHEPSSEDRAKMADAHQKMAECLRSTRPMKECRGEMKKAHTAWGHGQTCKHGEACPHDQACPHGESCDGGCKHHAGHGGKHGDEPGAMCENGKGHPKSKAAPPKVD